MASSTALQTRAFGATGMRITTVGLGTWAIGGPWQFGWGPQDDVASIAAIHRALDVGMNWIDTAAVYGLGHAEEVVARALAGMSERPYVFTKCERVWNAQGEVSGNLTRASLRREVEASLQRLRVDVIDLYQIHWPQPDAEIEEGWAALAELKREGKTRHIGVSNFSVEQLRRAQAIAPVETLQPPYSLLSREIEAETLPYCEQHNIGVIAYSPMASGLLSGAMTRERIAGLASDDWRRTHPNFNEPRLTGNLALAERLAQIGQRHGRSAGEVAIAWTLRLPAVTAAIVGARDPQQVDGVVGASAFRLDEQEIAEIEALQQGEQG